MSPTAPLVLLIDDDAAHADSVRAGLEARRYRVVTAGQGSQGWRQLREQRPDLLILDAGLPTLAGLDLCRRISQEPVTRPRLLFFTSALAGIEHKSRAYLLGVDDYLCKPFEPLELMFRIDSLTRLLGDGTGRRPTAMLHDPQAQRCWMPHRQKAIDLTPGENTVLRRLLAAPLRPVSGKNLARELQELELEAHQDAVSIHALIWRLRQKLEPRPDVPRYLVTISRVGYLAVPHGGEIPRQVSCDQSR